MIWIGTALAGTTGHLGLVVGGRTSPESAIDVPGHSDEPPTPGEDEEDEDDEFEPSLLLAVDARLRVESKRGFWFGVDGSAWVLAPEGEANRLTATPTLGWVRGGSVRLDLASRYQLDLFPMRPTSSSGRFEALARATVWADRPNRLVLSSTLVDRSFYEVPAWSFRSLETGAVWQVDGSPVRAEVGGSFQLNQGVVVEADGLERQTGSQVRAVAGLGVGAGPFDLMVRYRAIVGAAGDEDRDAQRAQFTPLGDYATDADAVSGGGFVQHRLELDGAVVSGRYTLVGSALGRLRRGNDAGGLVRTANAQLGVERELGTAWVWTATAGASAATLVDGSSFVDVYGWTGLRWRFGGDR